MASAMASTCKCPESHVTPDDYILDAQETPKNCERTPDFDQIPVVCIGNLVVGGSSKSPLVMSLALRLKDAGFSPGV